MKHLNFIIGSIALILVLTMGCKEEKVTSLPSASFSITTVSALADEMISFSNTSQSAVIYFWDFGDGSTSSAQNPIHSYSAIGNYTVKLIASGNGGQNTFSINVNIILPISDKKSYHKKDLAKN